MKVWCLEQGNDSFENGGNLFITKEAALKFAAEHNRVIDDEDYCLYAMEVQE